MISLPVITLPRTGRKVGPGYPVFVAAEIGINHNGDLDLAKKSIEAAAGCGVDAVKFQNYRTEDFLSDQSLTYSYISQGKTVTESQYDMFKRCELRSAALRELKKTADDCGVIFFSTPTSKEGVQELQSLGVPLLKNGSDFLGNLPLIECMAQTGLPTVLSTGMATLGEIDDAVRAFREASGRDLILLHCTSSYPTPITDLNMRRIPAIAAAFGCPVGFSDHSEGFLAAALSIVLGACFIEKHFTLDRNLPGPDHRFSSDPAEMRLLVQAVRDAEVALGVSTIAPTAAEKEAREQFRLSCVAARDLSAGEILCLEDIAFARPATGFPPAMAKFLIGKKLKNSCSRGQQLELQHLE
jgi:N-acetylneuraminate synthase/N,N'-diacetyllegionaminate synthase